MREIQARRQNLGAHANEDEEDRVGLGQAGHFDNDLYQGPQSKFAGYVTSIPAADEQEVSDMSLTHIGKHLEF